MTVDFGREEKTVPDTYSTVVENKNLYEKLSDRLDSLEKLPKLKQDKSISKHLDDS